MKKSPLQLVKDEFGSKEALAKKLVSLLDRPEGEDEGDFERRIRTASNKQLLRLWKAENRVKSDFGTKAELVKAIVGKKFPKGDSTGYSAKIGRYTKTRLLDLHDNTKQQ